MLDRDAGRAGLDGAARLGQPDERQARHVGVCDERVARLRAVAGHDVDDARREDARQLLGEHERRERRVLRWLEHDRVAGDERRADLHRGEQDRMVEGDDPADHPERLAQCVVEPAVGDRDRLAAQLQGEPGEVAQLGHADRDVDAHVAHRAAVVGGVEQRELLLAASERSHELQQLGGALGRRRRAPGGEGAAGRRDGRVDLGGSAAREAADQPAGGRVVRVDRLAGRREPPLAADQHGVGLDAGPRTRLRHDAPAPARPR